MTWYRKPGGSLHAFSGGLWTLETLFPAFSAWLDRTVGPK